jgi:serine/threonine protein phosphatase PrpC
VRTALLRGRDHLELGAVDAIAEANAAIALSRGGAPKRYTHSEPNEDGAAFARGAEGSFVAVADGHGGSEASEVALEHLLGEPAAQWTDAPGTLDAEGWRRQALAALFDANQAVRRELGGRDRPRARTTLSLAVVLPGALRLLHAAVGDSHLFVAEAQGVREIAPAGENVAFLGDALEGPGELAELARVGALPLVGVRAIVLVTDGLSERGVGVAEPATAVAQALRQAEQARAGARALALARGVAELALDAQRRNRAGDNVAVSALWISGTGQ